MRLHMFSKIQPFRIGASFRALPKNPFGQVLPLELAGLLAVYGTVYALTYESLKRRIVR